ncbi:sensor histidine kinase [Plebeiibacterium sediminum]|uniref:Histidine kinase n=1 Tax=Plebeiibacterium sediminum TaxID=2992112 RepID=A0AAE3M6J5_9BACT|nr:histidine kinase [Plebeiobacterium sediminum]MCW3787510.1 histidine kinase [Plebeiobacterium sediminum]
MKKILTLAVLTLCLISHCLTATCENKLPEEPWRALTIMERSNPGVRWKGDITIKLYGKLQDSDSLLFENAITLFNNMCKTIHLSMTSYEPGTLEFYFSDSVVNKRYHDIFPIPNGDEPRWSYNFSNYIISSMRMGINPRSIDDSTRQNYITNSLAFALFPKFLSSDYSFRNGKMSTPRPESIFNTEVYSSPSYKPDFNAAFSDFDSLLIKTVYSEEYATLLPLAKEQFDPIPLWLREYAYPALIIPLVLILFMITFLIILFYKKVGKRIKNKLLQFNVMAVLALLTVSLVAIGYYIIAENLHDLYFGFVSKVEIYATLPILLAIGLVAVNIFRAIELWVNKKMHQKYIKVFLHFISTAFIPAAVLTSFVIMDPPTKDAIKGVVIVYVIFVVIGVIRAFVSFFVLTEKENKIANEVMLANLRELKTKAELNALHSKINPHFLYNSLNSIAGLAKTDAEKTEHMALSLSKLFRYSINKQQSDWSTLEEEVEMVKIYLDIEKVRFDDRLEYSIDLPAAIKDIRIPRFLIQPLAENAIKHGISKLVGKAEIKVGVKKNKDYLEISVHDNGPEFPNELDSGFGLQSIYDKLEILYPDKFELHFINSPEKQILIKLF